MTYTPPKKDLGAFTCPYCGVYAKQEWLDVYRKAESGYVHVDNSLFRSSCHHCNEEALWAGETMVLPDSAPAPLPHADLPADCADDYNEARSIFSRSPRGAAALLRLCIQKLMPHIGGKGHNINDDIKALVQNGLPVEVQQALDVCRVTGNNAVHPGEMQASDIPEIASQMFELINFIVENRISQPKKIRGIFSSLPNGAQAAIAKRDGQP